MTTAGSASVLALAPAAAFAVNEKQRVDLPKIGWTKDGKPQYCAAGYVELYKSGSKVIGKTFAGYCTAKAEYRVELLGPNFPRRPAYGVNFGGYWSYDLIVEGPLAAGTWSACGAYRNANGTDVAGTSRCVNGAFK